MGLFRANEKQLMKRRNTTTTTVKNPNWPNANQLAIYKCMWEDEPGTTRNKLNQWSERVLNLGSRISRSQGKRPNHWAMHLPNCFMVRSIDNPLTIILVTAPSPPSDVKAGPADKRSITLSWKKPKISGDDVQMYTVID